MTITYTLNDLEEKRFKKFQKKHYKKCNRDVVISFVETGISHAISVSCPTCGKEKNISDYENW